VVVVLLPEPEVLADDPGRAIVPLIVRFGATYPFDERRRRAKCDDCGRRSMILSMRSWADAITGFAPGPKRIITDERGVAIKPNRPTHYHGGRPMEWWLKKQPASIQP
jgi:hypothetical protein